MRIVVAPGSAIVAVLEFVAGDEFIAVLGALVAGIALFVAARHQRVTAAPHAGWDAVEREVRRARRHGRSLTLHRIVAPGLSPGQVERAIAPALRTTDICIASGNDIYIAMPEVDERAAGEAVQRLCQRIAAHGARCDVIPATFPVDALTVHGLIEHTEALAAAQGRATR